MKLIKNNLPLFLAILTTIIAAAIFGWLTLNRINESGKDQHGADHDPVSPTSPVKYPGKLTEELRDFVAELEKRDADIRERAEDLQSIRNSIEQETQEFVKLKTEVINLQDQFDLKVEEHKKKYIELEQQEQENYRNLADTIESLSPSAAVTLFLQMNKDMDQEPPAAYPANYVNKTILGVLNLMDPRDIAPIFEEMNDDKSGTEESRQLAASLAQQLQKLVVEQNNDDVPTLPSGGWSPQIKLI